MGLVGLWAPLLLIKGKWVWLILLKINVGVVVRVLPSPWITPMPWSLEVLTHATTSHTSLQTTCMDALHGWFELTWSLKLLRPSWLWFQDLASKQYTSFLVTHSCVLWSVHAPATRYLRPLTWSLLPAHAKPCTNCNLDTAGYSNT